MTDRPDVLFVVLDSLRTDRVSTYGADRETTPALDRFAERATRYDSAYVPAPWTLPSHCSLFTGRAPTEHGVTNGFSDRRPALPDDERTVAETLSGRGYRTAGFSNNPWVGQLSGLDRGFDHFVEWDLEVSRAGADERRRDAAYSRLHSVLGRVTRQPLVLLKRRFFTGNLVTRARRWFDRESCPTFTFLNLMEAHSPYYPPERAFEELGLSAPGPLEARSLNTKLLANVLGKRDLSADERRRVRDFLDASIRYQDREFDRLLDGLRDRGRFEDALVVVAADHGKTLGEFDRDATPPHYLRDINVRVPLLVKRPGQTTAETVADPVELAGLFDLLVAPAATAEQTAGDARPVPSLATDDGYALVEDHVPHTADEATEVERWRALADGERTYLAGPDGAEYLLRGRGPDERTVPLSSVDDAVLERFRDALAARVDGFEAGGERPGDAPAESMDEQVASQLQDLGYLG